MAPSGSGSQVDRWTGRHGPYPGSLARERRRSRRSPMPPRSRPHPAHTPSLRLCRNFRLHGLELHSNDESLRIYGPSMASSSARGRTGAPRRDVRRRSASFASGCQPTSESITDAQCASKDGRSRRGAPGASPQKPSATLPYLSFPPRRLGTPPRAAIPGGRANAGEKREPKPGEGTAA